MVSLAIGVICDCRDDSLGHVGLGLVKGRVTDTNLKLQLLLYLLYVENWHSAQPTHVREGVLRQSTFLTCMTTCLSLVPCLRNLGLAFRARHGQIARR